MSPRFCLVALALLVTASPLAAQRDTTRFERLWGAPEYDGPRRLELSAGVGYALSTDWSDLVTLQLADPRGGVHQQVLMRNVAVAPGAGGMAAVTYWRGRHGFRVHAGFSRSCLTTAARCRDGDAAPPDDDAALGVAEVDMDVWRYGIDGVVGLRNWANSRVWRPYLVLGVGGVAYDSDADALPIFPGTFQTLVPPSGSPAGAIAISNGTNTLLIATDELGLENVLGLTVGVGMDLRVPVGIGGAGLRIELADQITSSPFSLTVTRLDGSRTGPFARGADNVVFRSGAIHNWRLTAGVSLEFGLNGPRTEHDPSPWR